jgi:hypothetical protein
MFTTLHTAPVARDAFGLARIGQSRHALMGIRYNGPDPADNDRTGSEQPPAGSAPPADGEQPPAGGEDLGFPANTPVAEMTADQKAAYWRHEAKKQQRIADSRKDYDTVKQERDNLKAAHATDEDRAIEAAKQAGAAEATSKHLKTAVRGHLLALTQRPKEDIDKALEFIDVTRFATENGDLDDEKLEAFAQTLGTGAPGGGNPPADPIREALDRQRQQGGGSGGGQGGGSIAAQEQLEYERLTGKNNQSQ